MWGILLGSVLIISGVLTAPFVFGTCLGIRGNWRYLSGFITGVGTIVFVFF